MYIKLIYDLDQFITIRLFDNTAVTKWFTKFSEIEYQQHYINSNTTKLFVRLKHPKLKVNNWNIILSTIKDLKSLGYVFPFELPNKFTNDQELLNNLHRFFTYNIMWDQSNEVNPYDTQFQTDLSFEQWHDLLDKINHAVHWLEVITTNPNKKILNKLPMKFLHILPKQGSPKTVLGFDQNDQLQNFTYFDYDQKPLVLLSGSITGKSILESFLTNDNPTLKDCTGRTISHGGFVIDLNNSRSKIYQSTEFRSWYNKFSLTSPLPLEFPIGHVINPEKLSLVKLLRLRKVLFLNI